MTVLDDFRLDHKIALVTGGNRGLGKVMAMSLAEAGAGVAVISRDRQRSQAAAEEIQAAAGQACRGYRCDVTDPEQVKTTIAQVLADFGRLDIVVNNAGISKRAPIEEQPLENFHNTMETNVTGMWLICREIAPHIKAQKYGRIINIGSMVSLVGMANHSPYVTSKGAVLQLTRALALEWAPFGITVNAILPGPFATELNKSLRDDPKVYQSFADRIPLGRWGELRELGGLTVFLASDASSFITGAGIPIDGGWTVQ